MKRHDLLRLRPGCLEEVKLAAYERNPSTPHPLVDQLITSGVPAIVRRQEAPEPGWLEVGFSSHQRWNGSRLRVASAVPERGVEEVLSPFAVMELKDRCRCPSTGHVLGRVHGLGAQCGVMVGLYGSQALELVTGLPYTTPTSDIDLYVKPQDGGGDIAAFYRGIQSLQGETGFRLDPELEWGELAACKLAELFSHQKTVLCKGLYEVELVPLFQMRRAYGLKEER